MKIGGMAQVLNHRNPAHATDSFIRLSKLRREGILCDLTILVQEQKFKAHKVVMAACSDYFFTAICGGKSTASVSVSSPATGSHMTIELQYVTMRGFAPLLEYAYTSNLNVNASDVIDVLAAASYMQMFDVANACSEFMRSNLLWTQSQSPLVGLPLLPGGRSMVLNGQNNNERGSSSPARGRTNGLPEAVNSLLQASSVISGNPAAGGPALGRPPMLLPISSMNPYEVNLQQWADSMAAAGTQNIFSRIVNGQSGNVMSSPPSSMSPASPPQDSSPVSHQRERRPSSLQPQSAPERPNSAGATRSEGGSPMAQATVNQSSRTSDQREISENSLNSNGNNNNLPVARKADKQSGGSSNRKSVAVKLETNPEDEVSNLTENGEKRQSSPAADAEDSWQSLQKLYSFGKSDSSVPSPSKPPTFGDEHTSEFIRNTMSPSMLSRMASANGIKMPMDKYNKDGLPKFDNNLPMVPNLNGLSMHRAILQQQQFLAQQQQQLQQSVPRHTETDKLVPELPAVPPSGQYMSVRRRTLQSNVPKPHQCQICGSRFTRFHNLKQHIKLHSGVKPYECDECGKRFTRNYTLRLHKMKHVGLRNFRCGTCDAAFTSLGEFRAHLRITMHSHLPVNENADSPHPQSGVLEPEDLSNGKPPRNPMKFGQFDCSMLNYGEAGSPGSSGGGAAGEESPGTISPLGSLNPTHRAMEVESPRLSDRSLSGSPQDLSAKRSLSDIEGKFPKENDSDNLAPSPKATNREIQLGEEAKKRRRLEYCESTSPFEPESEKSPENCEENDEPMSLVVDTNASN